MNKITNSFSLGVSVLTSLPLFLAAVLMLAPFYLLQLDNADSYQVLLYIWMLFFFYFISVALAIRVKSISHDALEVGRFTLLPCFLLVAATSFYVLMTGSGWVGGWLQRWPI